MMNSFTQHIIALFVIFMSMANLSHAQYFKATEAPNLMYFLHATPSDENNPYWAQDIYHHYAIKKYRDSMYVSDMKMATRDYKSTASTASTIQSYYASNHVKFFQPAFGLAVNKTTNKQIFYFLDSCRQSCSQMLSLLPDSCNRLRPCVRLREANFGDTYAALTHFRDYNYAPAISFPSNECTSGWLTAMLMSSMNPWSCDTIMSRGWQHGWFRELSGNMWLSDVEASRHIGSIAFARLMSIKKFRTQLRAMQRRTKDALFAPVVSTKFRAASPAATIDELLHNDTLLAKIASFVVRPEDESDGAFQSDLAWGQELLSLRDSVDENVLLGSSWLDVENALNAMQPAVEASLNPTDTPCLYELALSIESCCEKLCTLVRQESGSRRRPYQVFGLKPSTYENLSELNQTNSYPSFHSSVGFATALLMIMIAPSRQDTLLQIGHNYGLYRAIASTNWYSDIAAGHTVGCLATAIIATGSDFLDLLEEAIIEYQVQSDLIITDTPRIIDQLEDKTPLYRIDGSRASSNSRGILVSKNRKIFVP